MLRVVTFKADWPIGSPSPFCLKLETWLRMAEIPYEPVVPSGPPGSKTGKVPYLIAEDGALIADSQRIIEHLTARHAVALDAELSAEQHARSLLVRRALEDHLYFCVLYQRWQHPDFFPETARAYFGSFPFPIRWLLPRWLRRGVVRDLWGQGTGRRTADEVFAEAVADIDLLATLLGDRDYFLGAEPHSVDATAYGFLENVRTPPYDWAARDALLRHANLVAYLDRIEAAYWRW